MKLSATAEMVHPGSPKSPGGSPWFTIPANIRFHEQTWFMEQTVFSKVWFMDINLTDDRTTVGSYDNRSSGGVLLVPKERHMREGAFIQPHANALLCAKSAGRFRHGAPPGRQGGSGVPGGVSGPRRGTGGARARSGGGLDRRRNLRNELGLLRKKHGKPFFTALRLRTEPWCGALACVFRVRADLTKPSHAERRARRRALASEKTGRLACEKTGRRNNRTPGRMVTEVTTAACRCGAAIERSRRTGG